MGDIIKKTQKILFSTQGGLYSSALVLSFMIVVSRIFGFMRYRILTGYFTKDQLDIFFASFRIPDLIFELLITGALTSAFIPIFIKYRDNRDELNSVISSVMNIFFLVLIGFILLLLPFLEPVIALITPGYPPDKLELIVRYSRILLVGQLPFLVVGNFLTGVAQAKKQFLITTFPPILYNVSIILATLFLTPLWGLQAPVIGVVIGASLYVLIQFPLFVTPEFSYRLVIAFTRPVGEFFRVMLPRLMTIMVTQIDATIDLTLTTFLGPGSYTVFYLAQHLQLFPVSVIGMAIGQASLPYLSELYNKEKKEEFEKILIQSALNLFFLTVPIAVFFSFARTPLVRIFFGGQKFDWNATVQTAYLLSYFSLSLPLHSLYYLLTRSFYAMLDSRTPFFIGVAGVLFNTLLSSLCILVLKLPVQSLGLSFSLSITLQVLLLAYFLRRRLNFAVVPFIFSTMKIAVSATLAAITPYVMLKFLDNLILDTTRTINIALLIGVTGISYLLLYLLLSWLFGVKELYALARFMVKAKEFKNKITEMITSYD